MIERLKNETRKKKNLFAEEDTWLLRKSKLSSNSGFNFSCLFCWTSISLLPKIQASLSVASDFQKSLWKTKCFSFLGQDCYFLFLCFFVSFLFSLFSFLFSLFSFLFSLIFKPNFQTEDFLTIINAKNLFKRLF